MRSTEECSTLMRLHGMLSNQPLSKSKQFGDVIRALINVAHLPLQTVAKALRQSELTVEAWKRDLRLPEETEWPSLTQCVLTLIESELD